MSTTFQQCQALLFQLQCIAELPRLQRCERFAHVDDATLELILEQAARFADSTLGPLAASGDREGCRLEDGEVRLPSGTPAAYRQWCELGFPLLGISLEHEGMGFPRVALSAVQELLDGANLAFGMLGINLRCAALALAGNASDALRAQWLPGLCSGAIASTIAISEPQAGSDVGRILTRAEPDGEHWLLHGTKLWISYADHDATEQILHLILARVPGGEVGTRGLGLFLVPKRLDDGSHNGLRVARLEHKMGLHASPTCVLELTQAQGWLIGEPGKGLQALFVMMNAMRQAVTVQGAAVANAAALQALDYARQRPQGGHPLESAVPLTAHADVQRMLLEMTAAGELARALALRTASFLDLAEAENEPHWQQMAELMLPVAKTVCAELGFATAGQGIQVLGGYGYTSDYPMERLARDIRVAAIYEGTSGIQALDYLKRKLLADQGRTLAALDAHIRADLAQPPTLFSTLAADALTLLQTTLGTLAATPAPERGAYALLQLSALALHGWNAHCLLRAATGVDGHQQRLRAALTLFAQGYAPRCQSWAQRALAPDPECSFEQD
ncbi:MAG TPA: acyl-CoA dehydrogenase family protein [Hyphomicrobiales bacterium]|nr:acyl-CoA dehydrogenase family protein [Hyphomicrobiales bacterium]